MTTRQPRSTVAVVAMLLLASVLAATTAAPGPASAGGAGRGWLALGDSYSSGEGIPGTPAAEEEGSGVATQGRDCRRADGDGREATAWSVAAYRETAAELELDEIALVACTGAVTSEIDDQIGEARARFGRERWDLVTFSIGGNDVRFAEVLEGCLDVDSLPWSLFDLTPGCDIAEDELRARADDLRSTLAGVYDDVADVVSPGGDVIVVGYPQLVEEVERWDGWRQTVLGNCEGLQDYDIGMLRSATGYLNQQIALAAQDADARHRDRGIRFHLLDISNDPYEYSSNPTDRHALCSQDPWLNGITPGITSGDWWEQNRRSFHPLQTGHTNTGRVLATFLRDNVIFDDVPPIDAAQLLTAPVPSLCGHPAGTLVDGSLPGIADNMGAVTIDTDRRPPVIGDLDDDGTVELIAVVDCYRGGVGWPNSLLLYGPGLTFLDEFNLGQIAEERLPDYEGDRSGAGPPQIRDGLLHISWVAHRSGDFGFGPTLPVDLVLDVDGGAFTVVDVTRRDERLVLDGVIAAANGGNRSGLESFSLGRRVADDLLDAVDFAGPITTYVCKGGLESFSDDWVRDDVQRSCQLTMEDDSLAWAYLTYDYESTWTLESFSAEVFIGD